MSVRNVAAHIPLVRRLLVISRGIRRIGFHSDAVFATNTVIELPRCMSMKRGKCKISQCHAQIAFNNRINNDQNTATASADGIPQNNRQLEVPLAFRRIVQADPIIRCVSVILRVAARAPASWQWQSILPTCPACYDTPVTIGLHFGIPGRCDGFLSEHESVYVVIS
jgi:hypothetical protein